MFKVVEETQNHNLQTEETVTISKAEYEELLECKEAYNVIRNLHAKRGLWYDRFLALRKYIQFEKNTFAVEHDMLMDSFIVSGQCDQTQISYIKKL